MEYLKKQQEGKIVPCYNIPMTKIRWIITFSTILVVGLAVYFASLYARGYRLDTENGGVSASGIFVIKSVPDGAEVYIDGEFKTATNATINVVPGTYDVKVEKEGFISWEKQITIEKEIVTERTAHLFRFAPSLSAITFNAITDVVPSRDFTKLAYIVPPDPSVPASRDDKAGLWVMEMLNLPLGFSRDPRRITDGPLLGAEVTWSPDGRQIMLTTQNGNFLLNTSDFTPQVQRINIGLRKETILEQWEEEKEKRLTAQVRKLPEEVQELLLEKTSEVNFSPDEDMVLYTASQSAVLDPELITPYPGASTQKQKRDIEPGETYVYDIEEDRNFLIDEGSEMTIEGGTQTKHTQRLSWFPTSRHLISAKESEITIMDYDGTNRHTVYSGSFIAPHAYPTLSLDRLIILTNLGAGSNMANLYSLGVK